jgi:hypothetical protein
MANQTHMMKTVGAFIWKWSWCSWVHKKDRCYPTVWGLEIAKEMGIPYRPNFWHCTKCHPCGEVFSFK